MTAPFKACYVGPLCSGRQSSLAALSRGADEPHVVNARLLRGSLKLNGNAVAFEARVNHFRGYLFYSDANASDLPPELSKEIKDVVAADGLIAVIPCRKPRLDACEFTLTRLREDLASHGRSLDDLPVIFQITQLDYEDAADPGWVRANLRTNRCDYVAANPSTGEGVVDAMATLLRLAGY